MVPNKQQLEDAIEHISFEMNRYLYTAHPISLPGHYREVIAESCLLHSRNVGEFFFDDAKWDDIRVSHYYEVLRSKKELEEKIQKPKSQWRDYLKTRINKKLSHLTYSRLNTSPMNMQEIDELNLDVLIQLFEKNLPTEFSEKWNRGKSFSM